MGHSRELFYVFDIEKVTSATVLLAAVVKIKRSDRFPPLLIKDDLTLTLTSLAK